MLTTASGPLPLATLRPRQRPRSKLKAPAHLPENTPSSAHQGASLAFRNYYMYCLKSRPGSEPSRYPPFQQSACSCIALLLTRRNTRYITPPRPLTRFVSRWMFRDGKLVARSSVGDGRGVEPKAAGLLARAGLCLPADWRNVTVWHVCASRFALRASHAGRVGEWGCRPPGQCNKQEKTPPDQST